MGNNKKKGDEQLKPSEPPSSNKVSSNQKSSTSLLDLHSAHGQIIFVLFTIAMSSLIQFIPIKSILHTETEPTSRPLDSFDSLDNRNEDIEKVLPRTKPIYWTYGETNQVLKHVRYVLDRLGYELSSNESDWDLLWAYEYPFKHFPQLNQLRPHQKVNHFPGCAHITNKNELATLPLKYIPKAFKLPQDKDKFLEYTTEFPNKLFVQKSNTHRQIYIRNAKEIDFSRNDTFIQEFIDNPLLVDGHKFDLGVFAIITSIDPLRVYIYKGDILIRYCPVKYYPFDSKNVDKYVVASNYLPTWEVPSLKPFYTGLGFGMKDSFEAYMSTKGINTENIWPQVEDAIRGVILAKEKYIANTLKPYKSKRNFFELMRFDLMIDDELNVYVLEANLSPSLSTNHFKQNSVLYEQVAYSTLNLVGVGSTLDRESLRKRTPAAEAMVSSLNNIVVESEICSQSPCTHSCAPVECQLCLPCLSSDAIEDLHTAYREHLSRGETKRIFPVPIVNKKLNIEEISLLSPKNQIMAKWFFGKCVKDSFWCS